MRRLASLLALFTLLTAAPALAYTYGDTLTVIWRPLPNLPAIGRPGDAITVWANASSSAAGWNASIQYGAMSLPLLLSSAEYASTRGRWELQFTLPAGAPEEVYDLYLGSDSTPLTCTRHSVKVIPAYRDDYYFAQISDTHLPEHTFSDGTGFSVDDTTGMTDFDAVIEDLNVLHPEFILHTGDLVNEGELEEYLAMFEMGRAQRMLYRLRDPIFVSTGNHDIGGWDPTPPPPGTSRKNWWRYFGWPYLADPLSGDPYHTQNYSFDYGLLHCIGLEAYQNNGSYDDYLTNIYGPQSMAAEQMNWLATDVAGVPAGHTKLAFYHYDFGGTAFQKQFNSPAALGLDGVIWGHVHTIAEASAAARAAHPFNLGIQSVIYSATAGGRTFRMFRVHNGAITPGIMHHAGQSTDSLTTTWNGPNDGTRKRQSVTVLNRYGETWEHARLVFHMIAGDSSYAATGGTIAQAFTQGGIAEVYVDCVLPAGGSITVSVEPLAPLLAVGPAVQDAPRLELPRPNPFQPAMGPLALSFTLARPGHARVGVYDISGRRVASLFDGTGMPGTHALAWNGEGSSGAPVPAGVYLVRLEAGPLEAQRKITLVR